jgi:hypothetical protein
VEKAESDRVAAETQEEQAKIAAAKVATLGFLGNAAMAFGVFLALALYLIIAAAENSLCVIHKSLATGPKPSSRASQGDDMISASGSPVTSDPLPPQALAP